MGEEKKNAAPALIEARIYSLAATQNDAIVFLEELNGIRLIPIWIGPSEGQAIAIKYSGIPLPRPFTHDLMLSLLNVTGFSVTRITIEDMQENTFFAFVHIKKDEQEFRVDARPSDALALAVRAGCPIFVAEAVFEKAQTLSKPISEDEVKDFKKSLSSITPSDIFGDMNKKPGGKKPPEEKDDEQE